MSYFPQNYTLHKTSHLYLPITEVLTTSSSNVSIYSEVLGAGSIVEFYLHLSGILTSTWDRYWIGEYVGGVYKPLSGNIQTMGISSNVRENFTSNPNISIILTNPSTYSISINSNTSQTIQWSGYLKIVKQVQ